MVVQESGFYWTNKKRKYTIARMNDARKRMVALLASILVARHMNAEDFTHFRSSPRTENLFANAIMIAEQIVRRIEGSRN